MNNNVLWQTIREEAGEASTREPSLSSYLEQIILNHHNLESSLVYNLAEILGNSVVPALVIQEVFEPVFIDTEAENMRRDLLAYYERDPACDQYLMPLLYFKGFHALQVHRVAHYLWQQERYAFALYLQNQSSERFGVDIHPAARIGAGIMIDHATGVVIGETTVIGDDVSMLHSVTLGGSGSGGGDRHPKIGSGVLIAAGAKVLGNIQVGEGAKIGAGSLVLETVAPHTTVAGVPAKVVGVPGDASPALSMDQQLGNGS